MKKIGITGGIGSGKSVVSRLLSLFGVPVYIADEESKRLTDSSPVIREGLVRLFGSEIYRPEGGLNRQLLASHIFGNRENLLRVNQIIHPEVNRDFLAWVAGRQTSSACAIESAILFESGFDSIVDIRLMVYAPLSVRIQRAVERDGVQAEAIERRIRSQMPDEEKREMSDYVIWNDGSRALIPQVEKFLVEYGLFIPKLY